MGGIKRVLYNTALVGVQDKDLDELTQNTLFAREVALKSTFLGPQLENSKWVESEIGNILKRWFKWRTDFAPQDGKAISEADQSLNEFILRQSKFHESISELMTRFETKSPNFLRDI